MTTGPVSWPDGDTSRVPFPQVMMGDIPVCPELQRRILIERQEAEARQHQRQVARLYAMLNGVDMSV